MWLNAQSRQTLQETFDRAGGGMKPYRSVWRIECDGCVGLYVRGGRTHGAKLQRGLDRVCHIFRRDAYRPVLGQRAFGYQGKVLGISIDEPEGSG